MDKNDQIQKARAFRTLHDDPKLLVLPNIWDPIGARLLAELGYPAVATASAAVAFSLGYDDGQRITLSAMLEVIEPIAAAVNVPVSADIEAGYADSPDDLARNIREVLRVGAVGINLEDSHVNDRSLRSIAAQCERIKAVRAMADREGIPLFINARTDVFLIDDPADAPDKVAETIDRARAYLDAGADGIYPILAGDLADLQAIQAATGAPVNVYAHQGVPPMRELESAGISRLSIGPGLLRASLTAMKKVATDLLNYGPYDAFTDDAMTSDEIRALVSTERMP
ncbi:MAG: isocitrate lyase/phosphoenolpyruvate mutase family protein [Phycisphaerae bacterium]